MTKPRPKRSRSKAQVPVVRPEPTGWQQRAFGPALEKYSGFTEPATVACSGGVVSSPHSDKEGFSTMLATALGSRSTEWSLVAINHLTNAARARGQEPGAQLEAQTNAALAFMSDVAPDNTVEAALAVQMYATHELALEMMGRAKQTDDRAALNEYGNLATKLSRTFTTQLETLAKLRRGGEQVVKYVHVHEGGQAVVAGTIHQGGRANGKGSVQPHETGAGEFAERPSLSRPDPARDGVPITCDAQREMSPARREEHGGSEGESEPVETRPPLSGAP